MDAPKTYEEARKQLLARLDELKELANNLPTSSEDFRCEGDEDVAFDLLRSIEDNGTDELYDLALEVKDKACEALEENQEDAESDYQTQKDGWNAYMNRGRRGVPINYFD